MQEFLLIYQKKKAILTDFPKGYKLYAHRKKYPNKEERTDYYLFGIIISPDLFAFIYYN